MANKTIATEEYISDFDASGIARDTEEHGGFALRTAFPDKLNGWVILRLGLAGVRPNARVWVTVGEARVFNDTTSGMHFGRAVFTTHNVVATADRILTRVHIDWDHPLPILADYNVHPA